MTARRAEGQSYREIAYDLSNFGIPSKNSGTWTHRSVARILARETDHAPDSTEVS